MAANIDPATVSGGVPTAALELMDTAARTAAERALAAPGRTAAPTAWFSRFDPRRAVPVTPAVKVRSTITTRHDGENGLLVHADLRTTGPGRSRSTTAASRRPAPEA